MARNPVASSASVNGAEGPGGFQKSQALGEPGSPQPEATAGRRTCEFPLAQHGRAGSDGKPECPPDYTPNIRQPALCRRST